MMAHRQQNILHALKDWKHLLGSRNVVIGEKCETLYGKTTFPHEANLLGALRATDTSLIPEIVKIAARHCIPLYPISGGKNWGYGNAIPPQPAVILDLSQLKGISGFDAELGLVTIEPGVTQQDLFRFLKKQKGRFLVPVHGGGPECSIVGNALERGYGITPYADHFSAVMSLEAVLPDGSMYKRAIAELGGETIDHIHKWGLGPYLDGLFSQGSFGVVTSMTIALAPVPEKIELVFFQVAEDQDLENVIIALRSAIQHAGGSVGSFNLMNDRRVLSMMEKYPWNEVERGSVVPPKIIAHMAASDQVTAWTGIGAIYGHVAIAKAARTIIKEALSPHVARLLFISPNMIRQAARFVRVVPGALGDHLAGTIASLDNLYHIVSGQPSAVALPLAYWKSGVPVPHKGTLDPARDQCGLYWYSPLIPFRARDARSYVDMVRRVCEYHGIEPLITLTTLSERCFDSTVPILFNMADADERARALACHNDLLVEGQKLGLIPYRLGIDSFLLLAQSPLSEGLARKLKRAIDPDSIIAPGRYQSPQPPTQHA